MATDWERCYLPRGRYAHLRTDSHSWPLCESSQGRVPDDYHGTGSQHEYDTAASLPLCPACARRAGIEAA